MIEHENQMLESKNYIQLRILSCLHQYVFASYLEFFAFLRCLSGRNDPGVPSKTCHSCHRGDHIPRRSVEAKNGGRPYYLTQPKDHEIQMLKVTPRSLTVRPLTNDGKGRRSTQPPFGGNLGHFSGVFSSCQTWGV